jgi:hypothetical protein
MFPAGILRATVAQLLIPREHEFATPVLKNDGLRGVYHRARIRPTRSLIRHTSYDLRQYQEHVVVGATNGGRALTEL